MDSILSLRPFTPHRNLRSSIFTPNRRIKVHATRLHNPQIRHIPKPLVPPEASISSKHEERPVLKVAKQVLLAAVCIGVGCSPFTATAAVAPVVEVEERKEVSYESEGYAESTKRLLDTAAVLVRTVEEAEAEARVEVKAVEEAWRAVKAKKEELQGEIMSKVEAELRRLRRSKQGLVKRSDEIVAEVVKVRSEIEKALRESSGKAAVERMDERVERLEEEYGEVWESVGEIEDEASMRETLALSYGVRELCFIERECEQLVQSFTRRMRRKNIER